ncbi:MAG: hypothetical protein N2444_10250 [Methylocystis sp.]|nr:hypothetical protein [Methylocystis sp.]
MAFLASFLATLITLDVQFFDGATTREAWSDINYLARQVDSMILGLMPRR